MATERLAERDVVEVVDAVSACFEEGADKIGPPKRGEDIEEGLVGPGSNVGFGDEHGRAWRQAVVAPDLQDVTRKICLFVEFGPLQLTWLKRIMFERDEGK